MNSAMINLRQTGNKKIRIRYQINHNQHYDVVFAIFLPLFEECEKYVYNLLRNVS